MPQGSASDIWPEFSVILRMNEMQYLDRMAVDM